MLLQDIDSCQPPFIRIHNTNSTLFLNKADNKKDNNKDIEKMKDDRQREELKKEEVT